MRTCLRGFTLIELLIVVAIIAILAAIAVPNFLEAQTRAKVVQTRANCRSIATALESYRIDNNGALPSTAANYWWADRWQYYIGLSTPIPYMSSVPQDPFYRQWGVPNYGATYYYNYVVWDHVIIHALLTNPVASAPGIWSPVNPDRGLLKTYVEPAFHLWNHAGATYMFRGWGVKWDDQSYILPYDPTNGTISNGHIFYYN
jgi:type II secretion system protein G